MRGGSVYVRRKMCHSVINCHRSARLPRQPITTHTLTWIPMEHTCSLSAPHHHISSHLTTLRCLISFLRSGLIPNSPSYLPVPYLILLTSCLVSSSVSSCLRRPDLQQYSCLLTRWELLSIPRVPGKAKIYHHHHPISTVRSILKFYSSLHYSAVQINTCFFCFHNINKVCCVQAGCHYSLLFKITHWDL